MLGNLCSITLDTFLTTRPPFSVNQTQHHWLYTGLFSWIETALHFHNVGPHYKFPLWSSACVQVNNSTYWQSFLIFKITVVWVHVDVCVYACVHVCILVRVHVHACVYPGAHCND